MDYAACLIAGFFLGYGFRGFIGKEIKKLGAELKAEMLKAKSEVEQVIEKHI